MSQVSVRFFAGAAEAFGTGRTAVDGATDLAQLVETLADGDTRLREVLDQCSFFVNGEHCRELDVNLPEACEVDVLPPFAGG